MTNKSNVPHLENSCCVDKDSNDSINSINYFKTKSPDINTDLDIIQDLVKIQDFIKELSSPVFLFSKLKTKYLYGEASTDFSDETMYNLLIHKCNLLNDIEIPNEFKQFCSEKISGMDVNDTIKERIEKLNYNNIKINLDGFKEIIIQ
jgi:hypothetical protein